MSFHLSNNSRVYNKFSFYFYSPFKPNSTFCKKIGGSSHFSAVLETEFTEREVTYGTTATKKLDDGVIYIGEIKNNKLDGEGILTLASGETLTGVFKEGERGEIIITRANGDAFVGVFKKDIFEGTFARKNGETYCGTLKKDIFEGTFTNTNKDKVNSWVFTVILDIYKSETETIEACKKSAGKHNDAHAQFVLGHCYLTGIGVEVDFEKAFELFKRSARQGNAYAQYNLGYCYEKGIGVVKDCDKAAQWYTKSAAQGNACGQNSLGYYCLKGIGIKEDQEEAFKLFKKSARQGNAIALCNLGGCYYNGHGVIKNPDRAIELLSESLKKGYAPAQEKIAASAS